MKFLSKLSPLPLALAHLFPNGASVGIYLLPFTLLPILRLPRSYANISKLSRHCLTAAKTGISMMSVLDACWRKATSLGVARQMTFWSMPENDVLPWGLKRTGDRQRGGFLKISPMSPSRRILQQKFPTVSVFHSTNSAPVLGKTAIFPTDVLFATCSTLLLPVRGGKLFLKAP